MKLLICTQKVDANDAVLGFFHGWIEHFSKRFSQITVVCLEKGDVHLPSNVDVFSLGKESGTRRLMQATKLLQLSFALRHEYDAVFVHMNQEYVLVAGILWRIFGKKVTMWRNHPKGNSLTDVAVLLCHKVFCTSPHSYTAQFKKTTLMPAGIDTALFSQKEIKGTGNHILSLGRISPIKNIRVFIEALIKVSKEGKRFNATIVGDVLARDKGYAEPLPKLINDNALSENVTIQSGVPHTKTAALYRSSDIFVNLTPSGSFDKTILEAMATGLIPVATNEFLRGVVPGMFLVPSDDSEKVATALITAIGLSAEERQAYAKKFRDFVAEHHSLDALSEKLFDTLK
jgi:glycosyltransferase involved in cell wall biosynthesis